MTNAKNLHLNGISWRTRDDFYNSLFEAVGAPAWHGRNFNALRDSIINGQVNQIEIPYTVQISGIENTPQEVKNLVRDFCSLIKELHAEGHQVDVVCSV